MRLRARMSGSGASARSRGSSARNAPTAASCLSPTTSSAGTCPDVIPKDSLSSLASYPLLLTRRASSSQSTSTRPAGRKTLPLLSDACHRLGVPAALERSRSGEAAQCGSSSKRPFRPRWHAGSVRSSHGNDGAPSRHRARFVRPLLSQPGHAAPGGFRQPDRPAAAEAPRERGNSVFLDDRFRPHGPINGRFFLAWEGLAARKLRTGARRRTPGSGSRRPVPPARR